MNESQSLPVFTDGACSGNPGPGGWAWVTSDGAFDSGGEVQTTNQRMELRAVLEAVRALEGALAIHSDSTYVVNCFNDRWFEGWLKRGWRNSQKKPVANKDLWEPLIEIYLQREQELTFTWVKGHSGNKLNEQADLLAVEAREAIQATLGGGSGSANGSASTTDEPSGPLDPEAPWPLERAIAVFGPKELDDELRSGVEVFIDGLDPDYDIIVSGLRRGAELETAEMALARRVPVAVVLPYANPAVGWGADDLRRFDAVQRGASWIVNLELEQGPTKALAARDSWMEQAVVGAVVVADDQRADRLESAGLGVATVE